MDYFKNNIKTTPSKRVRWLRLWRLITSTTRAPSKFRVSSCRFLSSIFVCSARKKHTNESERGFRNEDKTNYFPLIASDGSLKDTLFSLCCMTNNSIHSEFSNKKSTEMNELIKYGKWMFNHCDCRWIVWDCRWIAENRNELDVFNTEHGRMALVVLVNICCLI